MENKNPPCVTANGNANVPVPTHVLAIFKTVCWKDAFEEEDEFGELGSGWACSGASGTAVEGKNTEWK